MATPRPDHPQVRGALCARALGRGVLTCVLVLPLLAVPAPPARADGAQDPANVLDALRRKRQIEDEQQAREFQRLLEQGRALLAERAYDDARRVLTQATRLRPNDEAASSLLAQVEAANPTAAPEKLLQRMKEQQEGKNALLSVQLGASLFEAQKAMKAGDHARALEHAERVLEGIAYLGEPERAAKLRAEAEAIVATARQGKEQAKAAELQSVIAAHREQAAEDNGALLVALNKQGWHYLDEGDAERALAAADDILRTDPGNRKGLYLRQEARRLADSKGDLTAMRTERKETEQKLLVDQLEEEMTVPEGVRAKIVLPGKGGTRDFARPGEQSMEPWEQQLRAKLKQPVEVELRNATIADACRYLSQVADCTVLVDPLVAKDTKRYTLPKVNMRLDHALSWVCRFGKVTYTLRDHAILVTAHGGLLDQVVTKNYDVSGLIVPQRCVRTTFSGATQMDDQAGYREILGSTASALRDQESKVASEDTVGEGWVRFIRSTVAPESWDDTSKEAVRQAVQPYTIAYRNGRIVVVHTPEVQEQIERLLDDFRRARNLQVHILARFLRVQMDFLERFSFNMVGPNFDINTHDLTTGIGVLPTDVPGSDDVYGFISEPADPWQQGAPAPKSSLVATLWNDPRVSMSNVGLLTDSGPLEIRCQHLGDHTCNAFLQAVLKRRKGTILSAPRLTCFNTQRANFQHVINYNYIRSLNTDGEPEIGNVPDGIVFDVQPFVSSDRRYITVVLQPQMRHLQSLRSWTYASGGLLRVVQVPTTELRSVATTVTVPDGGTMLVGGLAKVTERSGESGVPILNKIPLIRAIARAWAQTDTRESLIVLLTPEIVPDIFEE